MSYYVAEIQYSSVHPNAKFEDAPRVIFGVDGILLKASANSQMELYGDGHVTVHGPLLWDDAVDLMASIGEDLRNEI